MFSAPSSSLGYILKLLGSALRLDPVNFCLIAWEHVLFVRSREKMFVKKTEMIHTPYLFRKCLHQCLWFSAVMVLYKVEFNNFLSKQKNTNTRWNQTPSSPYEVLQRQCFNWHNQQRHQTFCFHSCLFVVLRTDLGPEQSSSAFVVDLDEGIREDHFSGNNSWILITSGVCRWLVSMSENNWIWM